MRHCVQLLILAATATFPGASQTVAAEDFPLVYKGCYYSDHTPKEVGCECGTSPILQDSCNDTHDCVPQNIVPHTCNGPTK
jgi:hypothetical protein